MTGAQPSPLASYSSPGNRDDCAPVKSGEEKLKRTTIAEVIIESEEVRVIGRRTNRDRCERCGEEIEIENQKEENHVPEERKTN